jgi:ribose/xylose/arabinose/galactoside ABC-type transport system permease subunit
VTLAPGAIRRGGVWTLVLALVLVSAVTVPEFAQADNVANLMRQSAALGIVAIGQTIVILGGGIDLSVGALMGLVAVVANGTMQGDPAMIPVAIILALGIGLAVGLFNGLMVGLTGINPLILTFGMLSMLQGFVFLYTDRTVGAAPPEFQALSYGSSFGIPNATWLLLGLGLLTWLALRFTSFGRYLYAVGSNPDSARRAGLPTRSVTATSYVFSSLIASVAGLVLAARLGTGYTLAGIGFEIDSIVAVVLGGTALTGGRGGVVGTFAGLLLLSIVNNALNLTRVSSYVQQIIKGLIVVAAVVASGQLDRRRGVAR